MPRSGIQSSSPHTCLAGPSTKTLPTVRSVRLFFSSAPHFSCLADCPWTWPSSSHWPSCLCTSRPQLHRRPKRTVCTGPAFPHAPEYARSQAEQPQVPPHPGAFMYVCPGVTALMLLAREAAAGPRPSTSLLFWQAWEVLSLLWEMVESSLPRTKDFPTARPAAWLRPMKTQARSMIRELSEPSLLSSSPQSCPPAE